MRYEDLYKEIQKKGSFLCVGLDSAPEKLPAHLLNHPYPIFEFNKAIIDATAEYCVAYKPNTAFFEAEGTHGWEQLKMTAAYIRKNYPNHFIIADAKRGDIGNTAERYAKAFFETMDFDAVTLAPYMGMDSIAPFLKYEGKWAIILALTSNKTAEQFETLEVETPEGRMPLYKKVILEMMNTPNSKEKIMFVLGATRPEKLSEIREYCPEHFFLVPGIGAQGGSLEEVAEHGLNKNCGLLVNSSRGIIFASSGEDFAEAAGREASKFAVKTTKK